MDFELFVSLFVFDCEYVSNNNNKVIKNLGMKQEKFHEIQAEKKIRARAKILFFSVEILLPIRFHPIKSQCACVSCLCHCK